MEDDQTEDAPVTKVPSKKRKSTDSNVAKKTSESISVPIIKKSKYQLQDLYPDEPEPIDPDEDLLRDWRLKETASSKPKHPVQQHSSKLDTELHSVDLLAVRSPRRSMSPSASPELSTSTTYEEETRSPVQFSNSPVRLSPTSVPSPILELDEDMSHSDHVEPTSVKSTSDMASLDELFPSYFAHEQISWSSRCSSSRCEDVIPPVPCSKLPQVIQPSIPSQSIMSSSIPIYRPSALLVKVLLLLIIASSTRCTNRR